MPHIIVKMYAGRSDEQKIKLAEEITKAIRESWLRQSFIRKSKD